MSRRRATLEQIACGEGTTPTERLRALELLREVEHFSAPPPLDLDALDDAELDHVLDDLLADKIVEAALTGTCWPQLGELIRREVEERVRELADADRMEAEVERRATEKAQALYAEQGLRELTLSLAETAPDGSEAAETAGDLPDAHDRLQQQLGVPANAFPDEFPRKEKRPHARRFRH